MPDYILEPLTTDFEDILQEGIDYIKQYYPDWEEDDAQLDYVLLRFVALKLATTADMASRVLRAIFVYFGATIANIPPITSTPSRLSSTWTAIDTEGPYVIEQGTVAGVEDSFGDVHLFATDEEVIIPAGSNSVGNVQMTALEEGTASNALSGDLIPVQGIDWLDSAATEAASSGGTDDEEEEDYLNRLSANFALMSPRPVLARDYALIARNIPGVWRAIAIDNYTAGDNQINTLTPTAALGGSFTITVDGDTTTAIPTSATASIIRDQLAAANPTENNQYDFKVSGGPLSENVPVVVEFGGRYQFTARTVSINTSGITGGSLSFPQSQAAAAADTNADDAVGVTAIGVDGLPISDATKMELLEYLQSLRQQNFSVTLFDPAYTYITVNYTAEKELNADAADVKTRGDQAIQTYLDPAFWGVPVWPPDRRGWMPKSALRAQELYTVLNNVDGLDHVSALTFNGGLSGTIDGSDKTLAGPIPLPIVYQINSTVT